MKQQYMFDFLKYFILVFPPHFYSEENLSRKLSNCLLSIFTPEKVCIGKSPGTGTVHINGELRS